jgi:hypothetical protein
MLIVAGTRRHAGSGTPVIYNLVFQWQFEEWIWRGEVALPGGKRRKLTGGVLPNVAEDKIADEVPWTVRLAIDSLDLEDLE